MKDSERMSKVMTTQKTTAQDITRPGDSQWQLIEANTLQQAHELITETFKNTYHKSFEEAWMGVNHDLKVELRGLKFVDGWISGFLLTPWMLCSLYIPVLGRPDIEIEPEWLAQNRKQQEYMVIGPLKTFDVGGASQKANLNYHPKLGHYLLQPLVQIMDKYSDNESAFSAWSEVINFRKAHYEKIEQEALAKAQTLDSTNQENEVSSRRAMLGNWLK